MSHHSIPRRTILRGAGGAALALPALDIMRTGRAATLKAPKRFLMCYIPLSTGQREVGETRPPDLTTPTTTGKDYEITLGLKAVGDYGVKADMGLVSGLTIPWKYAAGTRPPPGGGVPEHSGSRIQQACGYSYAGNDDTNSSGPILNGAAGPSADQALVPIVSDGSVRISSLPLRVSPSAYEANLCISSEAPDATSPLDRYGRKLGKAVTPLVDPRAIYEKLFGQGASANAGQVASAAELIHRQTSILDAVQERYKVLQKRLGGQDKVSMDRYFSHIRDLENSIKAIDPATLAKCQAPSRPSDGQSCSKPYEPNGSEVILDKTSGWCGETERFETQMALIHAAFACDLTRVSSWMMSHHMVNMYPINGNETTMHYTSHAGGATAAAAMNWHTERLAHLVKLLSDTQDIDGSRVIDNTVIVAFMAGGCGRGTGDLDGDGPETRAGARNSHSSENMLVLTAGGKNLGLQTGQHIHFDNDRHPAQVILTAMNALGYPDDVFGEVRGSLPEMRKLQDARQIVPVQ